MNKTIRIFLTFILILSPLVAYCDNAELTAFSIKQSANGLSTYSINIKMLLMMSVITFLPSLLMTMTSFTRIMIVLAILRQAIGLQNIPTNQILMGISLFLSLFVMAPVITQVNSDSLQPYLASKINEQTAINKAQKPLKAFMLKQTRNDDYQLFLKLSKRPTTTDVKDAPFHVIMPAFLTSELKTAFQMGFLIYLPFLIIDLVVSSVLMSMGMMMLSPLAVSLPFKIMLFVMMNGWVMVLGTLSASFVH